MSDERRALRELARLYGVQESYKNVFGTRVQAGVDSTIAVLRAMGAPVGSLGDAAEALRARKHDLARRRLEPVIVAWGGRLSGVEMRAPASERGRETRFALTSEGEEPARWEAGTAVPNGPTEDGSGPVRLAIGHRLPAGRHSLWVETGEGPVRALVLSAPRTCPQPDGRWWGVFAPLYALRAEGDWGVGSFSELAAFRGWIDDLGGSVAATLPLFAQFLDEPMVEPSPYSPASRLFWNETYIDVGRAPGLDACEEAREALEDPSFREQIARLRKNELTDHPAVAAAKRRVLDPLAQQAFRGNPPEGLMEFAANPRAADYARFRAEVERRGAWWGAWPRIERGGALAGSALDDDRARYHLFVQWVASQQLSEAAGRLGATGGLMLDLPIGVNGAGYDVWRERDSFAPDVAAGAPPDAFWSQGQDWGAPPPHPHGAREAGYRYHDEVFRTLFRYAAVARIDHVIGLHRLYWVPRGASARDGVYVRYRAQEWYALLSIAANDTGAVVVGEDLGTVPGYVRPAMKARGLLRTYVAQREAGGAGLPEPPAESVAALNTHDMPTWAGFWRGTDVPLREELGLIDHSQAELILEARRQVRGALPASLPGLLADPDGEDPRSSLEASLERLAASRAAIVMASLGDLLLEADPQNVPGTGPERLNWRRRYPWTLDEIKARPDTASTLERIHQARRSGGAGVSGETGGPA
ncbi:MAG: 4-alpha-glucanotransferase [Actinobacteria bacterium]|nr:4-alpha-glucanotransferase [Actinomycetota bacterium]